MSADLKKWTYYRLKTLDLRVVGIFLWTYRLGTKKKSIIEKLIAFSLYSGYMKYIKSLFQTKTTNNNTKKMIINAQIFS